MIDFKISSEAGRIGPLWWFNSDTRAREVNGMNFPELDGARLIQWGTFGTGRHVKARFEVLID